MIGNPAARHGSTVIVAPSCELAQVELAGRGAGLGPCARPLIIMAHEPQMPSRQSWSNATGSSPSRVELLVEDVEQLEERHVGADVAHLVGLEPAGRVRARLPPHLEVQIHACVSRLTCSCAARARRSRTSSGSLCSTCAWFSPVPLPRGDVREVVVVAERLAVLGLVLDPEVPAAALLAVAGVAARAARRTRGSRRPGPAFSSDWLNVSFSPSTRTSDQNSSRSAGISPSALSRLSALRAMPQLSHMILPSSRWK